MLFGTAAGCAPYARLFALTVGLVGSTLALGLVLEKVRLQPHAIEAAEQCGGTYIPKIEELQKINEVLENFPPDRSLLLCDEKLQASDTLIMIKKRLDISNLI